MIQDALHKTAGNKQKAAQTLGLSRQGLIKKLKRLGI
jgi:DNA-binding NtrC family response regulator